MNFFFFFPPVIIVQCGVKKTVEEIKTPDAIWWFARNILYIDSNNEKSILEDMFRIEVRWILPLALFPLPSVLTLVPS